jgi:sulfane dehydrogenase subunit SoxC
VTRIEPRALLLPPGFPDFMTRTRVVDTGTHLLEGRAWSGWGPVTRVEVSANGGRTWAEATLDGPTREAPDAEDPHGRWAWRRWTWEWQVSEPGAYTLTVRAHDATGRVQPADVGWNRQGMADTGAQRVPVLVRSG